MFVCAETQSFRKPSSAASPSSAPSCARCTSSSRSPSSLTSSSSSHPRPSSSTNSALAFLYFAYYNLDRVSSSTATFLISYLRKKATCSSHYTAFPSTGWKAGVQDAATPLLLTANLRRLSLLRYSPAYNIESLVSFTHVSTPVMGAILMRIRRYGKIRRCY